MTVLGSAGAASANQTISAPAATPSGNSSSQINDAILYAQNSETSLPEDFRFSTAKLKRAPSLTGKKFYRFGARAYEKNDLVEAERAFNAALRAESNALIPDIVLYLAKIAEQNDEMDKAFLYAFVYTQLSQPGGGKSLEEILDDPDLDIRKITSAIQDRRSEGAGKIKTILNNILVMTALGFANTAFAHDAASSPDHVPPFVEKPFSDVSRHIEDTVLYAQNSDVDLAESIRLSRAKYTGTPSFLARQYARAAAGALAENDLNRAELKFKAAMRNNPRGMTPYIAFYLAQIAQRKGEDDKALLYAFVYEQLSQPDALLDENFDKTFEDIFEDPDLELVE